MHGPIESHKRIAVEAVGTCPVEGIAGSRIDILAALRTPALANCSAGPFAGSGSGSGSADGGHECGLAGRGRFFGLEVEACPTVAAARSAAPWYWTRAVCALNEHRVHNSAGRTSAFDATHSASGDQRHLIT